MFSRVSRSLVLACGLASATVLFAQGGGQRGRGAGAALPPVTLTPQYYMGCVTGGNLQPTEQPFELEPSEPFILTDVVTRTNTTAFEKTNFRIAGINMTPWLGHRVKVEGTVVAPPAGSASGNAALPQINATRVTSIWGTCPSRPAWTPAPKP